MSSLLQLHGGELTIYGLCDVPAFAKGSDAPGARTDSLLLSNVYRSEA